MKITLSIPNDLAHRFQAAVPSRKRSDLVTRLIERELGSRAKDLAAACRAANKDEALEAEVDEWQSFDDGSEQ